MKRLLWIAVLAAVVVATWLALRAKRDDASIEVVLARERAAAHFEAAQLALARAELAPLIAGPRPGLDDLVRAAIVDFADRTVTDPAPLLERIRALDPERPELRFMQARLALERGDFAAAREHFEVVRRARPDDLPTRVALAGALAELDRGDEARALLDGVLDEGIEHGGAWYVAALYRLSQLAVREGDYDEAERLQRRYEQLHQLGYRAPGPAQVDQGELARLRAPRPAGSDVAEPPRAPTFAAEQAVLPELGGARELFAHDLDADGDADFLAAGERGLFVAQQSPQGWSVETLLEGPVGRVRAVDWGNRDVLDLVAARGAELVLLEHASGAALLLGDPGASRWSRSPNQLAPLTAAIADLEPVDFDHDGDLDLLVAGAFGARLYRNDGVGPRADEHGALVRGAFTDVSREASLPDGRELAWCATEDFDGDSDVDLLLGGPNELACMDNLRAGKFADVAARAFVGVRGFAREPVLADFDADGLPDVLVPGRPSSLWKSGAGGTFTSAATELALPDGAHVRAVDIDLDGVGDLAWSGESSALELALRFGAGGDTRALVAGSEATLAPLAFADLDGDLDLDFARASDAGVEIFRCQPPVGRAARLELVGLKDNRRAVGAIVETRTRGAYRRIYWRGEPELVGCGAAERLDIVRTTWTNGATQTALAVPPTARPFVDTASGGLEQSSALIGSCPFLYSWNGTKFEFVSDVLGVTPLGLPMAPGMLVPPDHDEYVAIRGEQLVARDGAYELALTEELREVTYLDRARLDVIDHPAGAELHPNERFTFPPFPEPIVHVVREPLAPVRALGSDGRDWSEALARVDDVHAAPFAPLEPQFLGLATPHWLELEFDPRRVRDAKRIRLVCTGWFFWTDASVNMASARTPGVAFVPPTLQLQRPDGAWEDAGPPLGFPAGKSKTMVIELGELLDRERPRMRLRSTLRLYWDAIQLAVDAGDEPVRVTQLEPRSARLWSRGFSRAIATGRSDLPERFDWDALEPMARWDQHPGRYTRYGECVELLGEIDDRYVILGSGDALSLVFDAASLPALPDGWTRDYQLFLDGWAKDRDPNTLEALEVEPLPFHGMSAYPYGANESFPRTPEHEAWRAEWNTRDARRWIEPLAPCGAER